MAQPIPIAVPGQLLGPMSEYLPGPGTHVHNSNLYASILGPIKTSLPPKPTGPQKRLTKITSAATPLLSTISIERDITAGKEAQGKSEILPEVNSAVLCRVTRITPRQAAVAILDVRATEKDKVKIFESFRPGDIVRAVVISLGDQANYYLSTARNDLGVIMATSEAGNAMYPVSWKEYKDPETGVSESRKVAKPF
ncbi:hypothetical protein B7494_g1053 [Chlorociboria aeruginascens]|nr:hypothetical protein B7494_g1053 [Chlorociboria aeruginascens]